jgi:nucleotide-binding universal stress UspA family protein
MNRPTIVVGVDRSSAGRAALSWAARRADDTRSPLILAHVIDDEWGVEASERSDAEHRLVHMRAEMIEMHPRVEVSIVVVQGNPTIDLIQIADQHALLVVGTHKTGFVQGKAFGSRSFRLAASAQVPVAVIPERTTGTRSGVVVGIDDTAAGREAIRFAAEEAERMGEDLVLLLATGTRERQPADLLQRQSVLAADALRIADHTGSDFGVRIRTVRRPAPIALVDASASASLLVVGSSRRHTAHTVALGPVTHDVLFNITTPTIVVHPPEGRERDAFALPVGVNIAHR